MEISAVIRIDGTKSLTSLTPEKFYTGTIYIVEGGPSPELFYAGGDDGKHRATYIHKVNIGAGTVQYFDAASNTIKISGGPIIADGTLIIDLNTNSAVIGTFGSSSTIPVFSVDVFRLFN
jgi:hypothetical protein